MPFGNNLEIRNTMKKSTIAIALALTALVATPQVMFGQITPTPITGSWNGLKAIPPGDELAVVLRNGQTIKGRLTSVSDTALTIARGKQTTNASRDDVLRIHRVISKSAARATLIGLAIGAGIGGVAGGVSDARGGGESGEYGLGVLIVGTVGAGVGAVAGYIIGSRRHRALVYETK